MPVTRLPFAAAVLALAAIATSVTATAQSRPQGLTRDLSVEQKDLIKVKPPASDMRVEVFADRADKTYRVGDVLELSVKTNFDAYVWVIDHGTSGKIHVLFPNQYQLDNRVLAHQRTQVPSKQAPWQIRVGGPAGPEVIKVIASSSPEMPFDPNKLANLGPVHQYRDTPQSLTRDLSVVLSTPSSDTYAVGEEIVRILSDEGIVVPGSRVPPSKGTPSVPPKATSAVKADDLYRLGEAAFYGDGATPNYRRALQLFTEAADGGHVGAMFLAGRIHEQGLDVDQSVDRAKELYRRAADLGATQAMVHLAILHVKPGSTDRQPTEAIRLLRKAATQGDGMAMIHLAKLHDQGHGVDRNPREGARYLLAALRTGAWTVFDQAPKMSEEARRELQSQLRDAGHYKGSIDGRIGTDTRTALADWAKAG